MKHIVLFSMAAAVFLVFCGTATAQIFGSPTATLDQGQFNVATAFGYEEREISPVGGTRDHYGNAFSDVILSYGVFDWMEAFVKVGIHHPEFKQFGYYIDSLEPGVGVGVRTTIWEDGELAVGWLNQVRFDWPSDRDRGVIIGGPAYSYRDTMRVTQIDTMIGPSYTTDSWSVYCGVLGSFVGGRLRYHNSVIPNPPVYTYELHDDAVGGVVGGSLKVMDNVHVTLEGSGMSDGWSASFGCKLEL